MLVATVVVAVAVLPAWGGAQQSAAASGPLKVRLQLKWKHQFQFAGYYQALEQGYYRDVGLDVEIRELQENEDATDLVLSGKAEFGIGNSELVLSRAKGKPVVLLASVFQHSPLVFVAMQDSGIDSIHDLAGRKVAVERQAAELVAYLKYEGVPLAAIERQPHAYSPLPLLEGKIDAMSAYSTDEVFLLQQSKRPYLIFNPRAGGIDFYGDSLFTTETMTRQHPLLARSFAEASLKGWRYALQHQTDTVMLIRDKYSKRHEVDHLAFEARETERLVLPDIVELGYTNRGRWDYVARTYVDLGMLDEVPNLDGFFFEWEPQKSQRRLYLGITGLAAVLLVAGGTLLHLYRMNSRLAEQVTERRLAEAELRGVEQRYRMLVEEAPFPIAIVDPPTSRIRFMNPRAAQVLGVDVAEVTSLTTHRFYHDLNDRERIRELLTIQKRVEDMELLLRHRDGTVFWATFSASVTIFEREPALLITFADVTRRREIEQQLRQNHDELRRITNSVPALIAHIDRDRHCISANSRFEEWLDVSPDELTGRDMAELVPEESRENFLLQVEECFSGNTVRLDVTLATLQGMRAMQVDLIPHFERGRVTGLFLVATDVTVQKEEQRKLREMANIDELTGLFNRRECLAQAGAEFATALRTGAPLSVAMLDIDFFKRVNDVYGHPAGDETLRRVAELLNSNLRDSDIVGRVGGEEFLLVMPNANLDAARETAQRLRIAAEKLTIAYESVEIRITLSFGVAGCRSDSGSVDEMIREADEALYEAKRLGRNRVEVAKGTSRKDWEA